MPKLVAKFDYHYFIRADANDALYNAGGIPYRAGAAGTSTRIGAEIDLLVKYQFNPHLGGIAGYSHFFPGLFVKQSGSGQDMDFIYLGVQYTF